MRLDDSTRDGQSKTDAAPALFRTDAEKLLEDALLGAGRQARSMVGHVHDHIAIHRMRGYLDGAMRRSIFHGIVDQIGQHLLDGHAVDVDQR